MAKLLDENSPAAVATCVVHEKSKPKRGALPGAVRRFASRTPYEQMTLSSNGSAAHAFGPSVSRQDAGHMGRVDGLTAIHEAIAVGEPEVRAAAAASAPAAAAAAAATGARIAAPHLRCLPCPSLRC